MGSGNHLFNPNNGMHVHSSRHWDRRDFVKGVAALAGAVGLTDYDMRSAPAELLPEITRIRLLHAPTLCLAPQYLAEQLLHLEGFSEVEYVNSPTTVGPSMIAGGEADFSNWANAWCNPSN